MVKEFIVYTGRNNISLNAKIEESKFETNPLLIDKKVSLIKYAAFFWINFFVFNNIQDEKKYAIKIFHSDKGFTGDDQMLLMPESMILQRLNHHGIVHFKKMN